jgi:hypothetical protein
MTTKTITLTGEDATLLGHLLSRALDTDPALNTGDEPSVRALLSDLQAPEDINAGQPSLLDPVPDTLFADRLFSEEDIISQYTREDAIADGALIDVSPMAEEAGFLCPVAVTAALIADIKDIPKSKKGLQDEEGRLWDVLYIGEIAGKILCDQNERRAANGEALLDTYVYQITMPIGRRKKYNVKLSLGFGDHHEPVATLMKPNES